MQTPRYDKEIFYNKNYMFSGKEEVSENLPEQFLPYLEYVNKEYGMEYNQVVVNWFENGDDYIPLHCDCEISKLENSDVIVVSIGANRTFRVKSLPKSKQQYIENVDITCRDGTVVCMKGNIQRDFKHGIPKSTGILPRISVSFRAYVPS
jgi:alkylated DNA repair dioxygenase AlkB